MYTQAVVDVMVAGVTILRTVPVYGREDYQVLYALADIADVMEALHVF